MWGLQMRDSFPASLYKLRWLLQPWLALLGAIFDLLFSFSFGDHFEWNKVTSCIHNILSGQRWIEHYGEIDIKNLNDDSCHCKVNFIKVP